MSDIWRGGEAAEIQARAQAIEAQAGQIATMIERAAGVLGQLKEMVGHRRVLVNAGQDRSTAMRYLPALLADLREQLCEIEAINAGQEVGE